MCPTGVAWVDEAIATDTAHQLGTVCSNKGVCDYRTGKCICQEGFEGLACSRSTCRVVGVGGGVKDVCELKVCCWRRSSWRVCALRVPRWCTVVCKHECSYHGKCVSMSRNAVDMQLTTEAASYFTNWDAELIYGCQCDVGYEGYDCSLRQVMAQPAKGEPLLMSSYAAGSSGHGFLCVCVRLQCPRGDDPMTTNQMNEIQLIYCRATDGYFILYLDGKISERILVGSTGSQIQNALAVRRPPVCRCRGDCPLHTVHVRGRVVVLGSPSLVQSQ